MSRYTNSSTLGIVILVLATAAALWSINRGFPELDVGEGPPGRRACIRKPTTPSDWKLDVPGRVTVHDQDGRVVFHGEVDLSSTLDRIERGERLHYHDDGSTFQNREHRLPQHPEGYYTEYVHSTPNLSGPGPQRVVIGREGEVFYTPDHYRTFMCGCDESRFDESSGRFSVCRRSGDLVRSNGNRRIVQIPRGIRVQECYF